MGTVATYLPGRRIAGLRVGDDDRIEVHLVMTWGSTVDDVEAGVIRALDDSTLLGSLFIDDIANQAHNEPSEALSDTEPAQLPPAG